MSKSFLFFRRPVQQGAPVLTCAVISVSLLTDYWRGNVLGCINEQGGKRREKAHCKETS